jgi:hypothetical protein
MKSHLHLQMTMVYLLPLISLDLVSLDQDLSFHIMRIKRNLQNLEVWEPWVQPNPDVAPTVADNTIIPAQMPAPAIVDQELCQI